jgi:hypothetical protein
MLINTQLPMSLCKTLDSLAIRSYMLYIVIITSAQMQLLHGVVATGKELARFQLIMAGSLSWTVLHHHMSTQCHVELPILWIKRLHAGLLCACFINRAGSGAGGGLSPPPTFIQWGAEPVLLTTW